MKPYNARKMRTTRLERFFMRCAARFLPSLRSLLASSDGALDTLASDLEAYRSLRGARNHAKQSLLADMREACMMSGSGPWLQPASISAGAAASPLRESMRSLEDAINSDPEWQRMSAMASMEFSQWGIKQIIQMCRLYWVKNPLIRRGVEVSSHYVFGRGVQISSPDETADKVLQRFWTDPRNQREIGHAALSEKESAIQTDGNVFFVLFTGTDGAVLVRSIDPLEIEEIVTDPQDGSTPLLYRRCWVETALDAVGGTLRTQSQEAWYPALGYKEPPATVNNIPVVAERILHTKDGGLSKWLFGCPPVYPAIDWARAYRQMLEDWATLTRALARFAWDVETKGGAPAIESLRAELASTLGIDSAETNPAPTTGSAFIHGGGAKMTPVKTAGATTSPEAGRRLLLMVAAAFGLPETFFGDVNTGNLATGKTLDRPTELKFLDAQERWREVFQTISRYVLARNAVAPAGTLREAKVEPAQVVIEVKFPSILEHDVNQTIAAIVDAMTLKGNPVIGIDEKTGVKLLLTELGVENVQAVLDAMYPEATYEQDRTLEPDPQPTPPQPQPGQMPPQAQREALLSLATDELRKALVKLQEKEKAA